MGAARRSREACRLTVKAMARRRGRVGLGLALHTPRHSPVTPEACGHAGKETSPQAERLEPQERGWADRVGGGAPNTRTSSGREGAAWGDGSVLVGPLPGTGEEHAQGGATDRPRPGGPGPGLGAPDPGRPGGQAPTELQPHGKDFLPEGVGRHRCPHQHPKTRSCAPQATLPLSPRPPQPRLGSVPEPLLPRATGGWTQVLQLVLEGL